MSDSIHTIVFEHSRYHLRLVLFLAIRAGAAWSRRSWRSFLGTVRATALAPIALATMLVLVWSHEVLFRDADHIRALLQALR